jgi:hypothetical protein
VCAAKRLVIDLSSGQGIVLQQFSTAFLPRPDGTALILFWVGADEGAHVLEAVLSAPEKAWKQTKETFTMIGSKLALIDAASDGKRARPSVGTLAVGTYRIDRMREYDGRILVASKSHDLMATAIRLRPV